jgi:hypothetical protein
MNLKPVNSRSYKFSDSQFYDFFFSGPYLNVAISLTKHESHDSLSF